MLRRSARARVPTATDSDGATSPHANNNNNSVTSAAASPESPSLGRFDSSSPMKRKRGVASPAAGDGSPPPPPTTTNNEEAAAAGGKQRSPSSPPLKSRKVILQTRSSRARLAGSGGPRSGEAEDNSVQQQLQSSEQTSPPTTDMAGNEAKAGLSNGSVEHHEQTQQQSEGVQARDLDVGAGPSSSRIQEKSEPVDDFGIANEVAWEEEEEEEEGNDSDDLLIEADVRTKLTTVLETYFGNIMALPVAESGAEPKETKESTSQRTTALQDVFRAKQVTLKSVRRHLVRARKPLVTGQQARALLSGSHVGPGQDRVEADRKTLSQINMLLALIDEVATSLRQDRRDEDVAKVKSRSDKDKTADDKDDAHLMTDQPPLREAKYAMHMRLPGGDYYTNAIRLRPREALDLDTGYANLVSVAEPPPPPSAAATTAAKNPSEAIPTLGQRLAKSQAQIEARTARYERLRRERANEGRAKPVSHLYYGPYASYAPTYDSSEGTMGLAASCALWRSRHEDRQLLQRMVVDAPPPPSFQLDGSSSSAEGVVTKEQDIDELVASLGDVIDDRDGLLQEYMRHLERIDESVEDDVDVSEALAQNEMLIALLGQMQEQRIQRAFAEDVLAARETTKHTANKDKDVAKRRAMKPSREEEEVADALVSSLARLVAQRPRDGSISTSHLVVPARGVLQRATSSAIVDPAIVDGHGSRGYWGVIDEASYLPASSSSSSSRRSMPSSSARGARGPPAIRDNETVRLTSEAEAKAVAASRHRGAPCLGSTRDRGRDLLERIATTRGYTSKDHPHDRPPPPSSSTSPVKKVPPPVPSQSTKPGGPAAAASSYAHPQQQQQQQQQAYRPQQQQPMASTPLARPTQSYAVPPKPTTPHHAVNGMPAAAASRPLNSASPGAGGGWSTPQSNPYYQQQQQQQRPNPQYAAQNWSSALAPQQQQQQHVPPGMVKGAGYPSATPPARQ